MTAVSQKDLIAKIEAGLPQTDDGSAAIMLTRPEWLFVLAGVRRNVFHDPVPPAPPVNDSIGVACRSADGTVTFMDR
jgi:hypothetical protein